MTHGLYVCREARDAQIKDTNVHAWYIISKTDTRPSFGHNNTTTQSVVGASIQLPHHTNQGHQLLLLSHTHTHKETHIHNPSTSLQWS